MKVAPLNLIRMQKRDPGRKKLVIIVLLHGKLNLVWGLKNYTNSIPNFVDQYIDPP